MPVFEQCSALFTTYRARLVFRDKLVGGIPKDPKLIEGWLRTKAGIDRAQELREAMLRTLAELGANVDADRPFDELVRASSALAATRQTTGFKVGSQGLYIESRQVKAMLKESANVVFAGERWGATRKSAKAFVAERVFVQPDKLWLGVQEPSGVEPMVAHLTGPKGPHSAIGYHEYVERAVLYCEILTLRDCLTREQWRDIWLHAQESGLGAKRSQGFGRFDLEQWERVS